jgi:hypothetical protein
VGCRGSGSRDINEILLVADVAEEQDYTYLRLVDPDGHGLLVVSGVRSGAATTAESIGITRGGII